MPASITLTVSHLASSTSFFLACLQPLKYVYRGRVNDTIGFGQPDAVPDFWITQSIPGVPPGPAHVAFPAMSRGLVHDFYLAAMKAGGRSYGEPALRDTATGYFSAAVIDFDGNSIEAVYRPDLIESQQRSSDAKSVVSTTQKSIARSKAPTTVSSASKSKSTVSADGKSTTSKSTVSKAPSSASKTPSAAPSQAVSRAPSKAPSTASSRAPSQVPSRAPSQVPSRAPSQAAVPAALPSPPQGSAIESFLNEARGTINVARELVGSVTPSNPSTPGATSNSHGPSDAIVGTLLGVAAGAALHYAFSSRNNNNNNNSSTPPSPPSTPPKAFARSETVPSYADQRMHYYYNTQPTYPYAIEAAPETSASHNSRGQRLIEMVDRDQALSEIAPSTARSRRRSSFSGAMPVASAAASNRTVGTTTRSSRPRMLETAAPPPTSYRAPTAITQPDTHTHVSRRSSRSRASSLTRIPSKDEGYASATESRSRVSRRSSKSHRSHRTHGEDTDDDDHHSLHSHRSSHHSHRSSHKSKSETPSRAPSKSRRSSVSTMVPAPATTPSVTVVTVKKGSVVDSFVTAVKNHIEPPSPSPSQIRLPPSRAATWTGSGSAHDDASTHSKSHKTVIGKLTRRQLEKLEDGGRDITKSVIGKVKDADGLKVSRSEVRPEDSVSQVC